MLERIQHTCETRNCLDNQQNSHLDFMNIPLTIKVYNHKQ